METQTRQINVQQVFNATFMSCQPGKEQINPGRPNLGVGGRGRIQATKKFYGRREGNFCQPFQRSGVNDDIEVTLNVRQPL